MCSPVLRRTSWFALLLVLVLGCGKRGTQVSGNVSYDGEPIVEGWITFQPEDGKTESVGAKIRQGRYKAENVPPGPKRVLIQSGDTSGAKVRDSGEEVGKVGPQMTRPREDLVPPDADGNNQLVDVAGKVMRQDFELQRPKRETQPGGAPGRPGVPGQPGKPK